jgi:hypothetical protein
MSLREKINENPQVAAAIGGGIAVVAVLLMLWTLFRGGDNGPRIDPDDVQVYYSTDEGATYTPGLASERLTPGRVQAHVFTPDSGKTLVVGYVERWTPEGVAAQKDLEKAIRSNDSAEVRRLTPLAAAGHEVKKPPKGEWIKANAAGAADIINFTDPKGELDYVETYPPPKK